MLIASRLVVNNFWKNITAPEKGVITSYDLMCRTIFTCPAVLSNGTENANINKSSSRGNSTENSGADAKAEPQLSGYAKFAWGSHQLFGPSIETKRKKETGVSEINVQTDPEQIISSANPSAETEVQVDNCNEDKNLKSSITNFSRTKAKSLPEVMNIPKTFKHLASNACGISKILDVTMPMSSRILLLRWRETMIAKLGKEGFEAHQQETLRDGRAFHSNIKEFLMGADMSQISVDEANCGHWKSVHHILQDIKSPTVVESFVCHPELNYHGILDCVAQYKGTAMLIDWKTSLKPKYSLSNTYDNPLQVVAYLGALNHDEKYKFQVENAAIAVAYRDGSPGHFHYMDKETCLRYWDKWLQRLKEFREKVG